MKTSIYDSVLFHGPMFAGKTTELIKRIIILNDAGANIQAFKPVIENRYGKNFISSHNGLVFPAENINKASEIEKFLKPFTQIIAIDEVQFLDEGIIDLIIKLRTKKIQLILAGLLLDSNRQNFGFTHVLLNLVDKPITLKSKCSYRDCISEAEYTQRLVEERKQVLVGLNDKYAPRCLRHHFIGEI